MPDYFTTVVLAVGGWVVGIVSATYLQDRARRVHRRAIAGALLAEVRRLQEELAHPFSSGALVPTLNPWVQSAFVDAAGADSRLVEHFLTLERHLFNLRSQQTICQELARSTTERLSRMVELEARLADARRKGNTATAEDTLANLNAVTAPLEHSQRSAQDQEQVRAKIHERALGTLTELEKLLTAIAGQRPSKRR